jgi:N-acetyl-gamma-glutamyl-phosphate reductase
MFNKVYLYYFRHPSDMIKVGIMGGAGYTAGELLRILLNHPAAEISFVHSKSNANKLLSDIHTDLLGETTLAFTSQADFESIDVLFLCMGHGDSKEFLNGIILPASLKVIDLSQDFRLHADGNVFVYGLPELNRSKILNSSLISNPGCFATCIQLSLLPLFAAGMVSGDVHINGITGSTGAGQAPSATTHFSWRNNNISVYKAFEHQHLKEIRQSFTQLMPDFKFALNFIPMRGDFPRGILATAYTKCTLSRDEALKLYSDYYALHPFVNVSLRNIDMKMVVNTNKCILSIEKHDDYILITSAIDNLIKGASGQAVQNMNLIFGLEETCGLKLKSIAF